MAGLHTYSYQVTFMFNLHNVTHVVYCLHFIVTLSHDPDLVLKLIQVVQLLTIYFLVMWRFIQITRHATLDWQWVHLKFWYLTVLRYIAVNAEFFPLNKLWCLFSKYLFFILLVLKLFHFRLLLNRWACSLLHLYWPILPGDVIWR